MIAVYHSTFRCNNHRQCGHSQALVGACVLWLMQNQVVGSKIKSGQGSFY